MDDSKGATKDVKHVYKSESKITSVEGSVLILGHKAMMVGRRASTPVITAGDHQRGCTLHSPTEHCIQQVIGK